ncbi:MAG: hypothetical protein A2Y86_04150 [Candidatus Aminicenantes bacterium RBG_13_62_12]|nr:MAG: hypothetical protein A2Y86_04150 [Candidatus Aminicenantes bacterium RBG_13_62_12]
MKFSLTRIQGIFLSLVLLAGLATVGIAQEQAPQTSEPAPGTVSVIKEIRYEKIDIAGQLVVMIKIEGPFLIETFTLIGPKRLVIDFSPVSVIEAPPITEVNATGLLNIRTGQFQSTVARVVFDLDSRVPSHSVATLPEGVKVTFWQDPEPQPVEQPAAATVERPALKPAVKSAAPSLARPGMFLRGSPGGTLFLKPSFSVTTDFDLYGETATITETLSQQVNPVFDLGVGKLINPKFSAGLGASLQLLYAKPALEASLPHPFLYDTYREVAFDADALASKIWVVSEDGGEPQQVNRLTSNMWTVYAWALYSLFQTDTMDISAGPILGFSFGKLYSLDDFELAEEAPYESQDVSISSVTFIENKFFKVDPGLMVSGTFVIGGNLSAFATLKVHYVDVMVETLERRASLFRLNLLLGLEYGF